MRRTKEDAELTRQAILMSAMDTFFEKGYSKTTFDERAKRINLTKGAVYWYFRNKPDMVAALINEYAMKYFEEQQKIIPQEGAINFDDLINLHLYTIEKIRKDNNFYKFIFFIFCQMEWSEAVLTKVRQSIEKTKESSRVFIHDTLLQMQNNKKIKQNIDIKAITDIIFCTYAGIIEGFLTKRIYCDVDNLIRTSFNLIFDNIKMEGTNNEN